MVHVHSLHDIFKEQVQTDADSPVTFLFISLLLVSVMIIIFLIGTVVILLKRKKMVPTKAPIVKRHKPKPKLQEELPSKQEQKEIYEGDYLNKRSDQPNLNIFNVLFHKNEIGDTGNINLNPEEFQYENPSVYVDYANDVGSPQYQNY